MGLDRSLFGGEARVHRAQLPHTLLAFHRHNEERVAQREYLGRDLSKHQSLAAQRQERSEVLRSSLAEESRFLARSDHAGQKQAHLVQGH